MRYITALISFLLVSMSVSCQAQAPENRKLWVDPEDRAEFVKRLRENNVPYRIDDQGGVWYPADRTKTVDAISSDVLKATAFRGTSFSDPNDTKEFTKRLDRAGIPYASKIKLGETWITWEEKYDGKARQIRDQIDDENMKRRTR